MVKRSRGIRQVLGRKIFGGRQGRLALTRLMAVSLTALVVSGCLGSTATTTGPTAERSQTRAPSPTPPPTGIPEPTLSPKPNWVPTGSLVTERVDAAAVRLAGGQVLIVGGSPELPTLAGPPVLATAELYDPLSHKFAATGSMNTPRSHAAVALLPEGRVLVAGGYGCRTTRGCAPDDTTSGGGPLASAELYDPASGKFSSTGSMSKARSGAIAVAVSDGRILLVGGGASLVEAFDPASGTFAPVGTLRAEYADLSAVAMPNDRILVVGPALSGPDAGNAGAEIFDASTGQSTPLSIKLPTGAATAAAGAGYSSSPDSAIALKDGRLLLCVFDYLVIYDPATGSFTQSGSISPPAKWLSFTSTLLPDGRVLFAGGQLANDNGDISAASKAGMFDPSDTYQPIGPIPTGRSGHTSTLLTDGTILIAGGADADGQATKSAELLKA